MRRRRWNASEGPAVGKRATAACVNVHFKQMKETDLKPFYMNQIECQPTYNQLTCFTSVDAKNEVTHTHTHTRTRLTLNKNFHVVRDPPKPSMTDLFG